MRHLRYEPVIRKQFQVQSVSGAEFLCMCRWHDDSSGGHLYVNGHSGLFVCFSCGQKGSLERMNLEVPQISTQDVRERLKTMGKTIEERFYPEGWLRQFDVPTDYWTEQRNLPQDIVKMFDLGYDPFTDRVTLPLRDMHGRILGVTHRRLDGGKPKYLHPKGYPIGKHLYGAFLLREERTVALVEGQVDAHRGWSHRVPALALMGARITPDQIKVLKMSNVRHVVLMLDNDNAGIHGTMGIYESLQGTGIRVSVGWYRDYWFDIKDPDALSGTRYRKMFHSGIPITDWASRVSM